MKKLSKIVAIFMTCVLSVSFGISCSDCKNDDQRKPESATNGNHQIIIEEIEGSDKIVSNGKSSYVIVIPKDCESQIDLAAEELQYFIEQSTGVILPIVKDTVNCDKFFSIGETSYAEAADVKCDYSECGPQGFKIRTVGDDIYILGAMDKGTLNGVYGYLEHALNFDCYYTDVYDVDRVSELSLYDYNIIERPDIDVRAANTGHQADDKMVMNRQRLISREEFFLVAGELSRGQSVTHTGFKYFPVIEYGKNGSIEQHEEWYVNENVEDPNDSYKAQNQFCYTAHGNQDSLKEFKEKAAQKLFDNFRKTGNEKVNVASFSMEDNTIWCSCPTCNAIINDNYGAYSSTLILFINDVAELLEQKFKEVNDPRTDTFLIITFAYFKTVEAPVQKDANGNYLYNENMKLHKHVAPFFAPITHDYTKTFSDSETAETLRKWSALSEQLYFWGYDTYFPQYTIPYNSFSVLQDMYKCVAEVGVSYIFNQSQLPISCGGTGYAVLRGYLNAKLGWNVNYNVEELINKFFKGMYGSQWQGAMEIFDEYRIEAQYQSDVKSFPYSVMSQSTGRVQFWDFSVLQDWLERYYAIRDALLKNGEKGAADLIELEMLFPVYILADLFSDNLSLEKEMQYKKDFKAITTKYGITDVGYYQLTVPEIIDAWGI